MSNWQIPKQYSRAGYSLVEVTLALLVVAIGLTSTFALFPEAMKDTRTAVSDTEVGLFADYVFSTLAVTAARFGKKDVSLTKDFGSRALSQEERHKNQNMLDGRGNFSHFYWIAEDDNQGVKGDWAITKENDYWSTAFSYKLSYEEFHRESSDRPTYRAILKVWPGEWQDEPDEKKFKPYVFYREVIPYPDPGL